MTTTPATTARTRQQLLIGGQWRDAASGRECEQRFPYTGEVVGTAAAAQVEDARAAVEAARNAFEEWSGSAPAMRRAVLSKAADLLMERQQEIARIVTEETGGVFGWGMFNVELAAGMLREAAAQAYGLKGDVIPSDVPGKLAMGVRQPAGVVVAIAPWNAPVILATRAVAAPLAYANTVVLKASEISPRTHAAVARALIDAGLPEGAINFISNDPADAADVVEALIAHPATRRINFTGSTKVGRIIAEKAGRHLKRVLLELGGKAPMVVLRDANLDRAAAAPWFYRHWIEYLRGAVPGDELRISTRLVGRGHSAGYWTQEIRHAHSDELMARGECVTLWVDTRNQPVVWPQSTGRR